MKVVCYANSAPHQIKAIEEFIAGLAKHGISATLQHHQDLGECDLAVFWGHRQHGIIQKQRSRGRHYLVMERGYIGDRFLWTSLGFDGLNGRARFPAVDDGGKRWEKHFASYMKNYQCPTEGLFAVIMGQVRGDESVRAVDFQQWVINAARSLEAAGFTVYFRPHPGEPNYRPPAINMIVGTLANALDQTSLVVTYNSNSGVDAIMAGVPTYAADPGSMVWELSRRDFTIAYPSRFAWAQKMAFTQWLPEEIASGDAWEALRTVIDAR